MKTRLSTAAALLALLASTARAQTMPVIPNPQPPVDSADAVATLVGRLDLERYKATIKGLTQFGDRRQGTERNRDAVDWIEAQLKSYGCTNTERITYDVHSRRRRRAAARQRASAAAAAAAARGARRRRAAARTARHPQRAPA